MLTGPIEYVYFIKAGEYVKIGRTTKGIDNRIKQFQTASPYELKCKMYFKIYITSHDYHVGEYAEKIVQNICKEFHVRGEWFRFHDSMRAIYQNIGQICREFERSPGVRYYKICISNNNYKSRSYSFHRRDDGTEILEGVMLEKQKSKRLYSVWRE